MQCLFFDRIKSHTPMGKKGPTNISSQDGFLSQRQIRGAMRLAVGTDLTGLRCDNPSSLFKTWLPTRCDRKCYMATERI